jgi:hypothetical protein
MNGYGCDLLCHFWEGLWACSRLPGVALRFALWDTYTHCFIVYSYGI